MLSQHAGSPLGQTGKQRHIVPTSLQLLLPASALQQGHVCPPGRGAFPGVPPLCSPRRVPPGTLFFSLRSPTREPQRGLSRQTLSRVSGISIPLTPRRARASIQHSVHKRSRRADRARFANALHAQGVGGRWCLSEDTEKAGQFFRQRQGIIQQRAAERLAMARLSTRPQSATAMERSTLIFPVSASTSTMARCAPAENAGP